GFIGVLNSATIVGAVIKTAETGQRVELDSGHGIRVYNADGELVLSADPDGELRLSGDLRVGGRIVAEQSVDGGSSQAIINPDGVRLSTDLGGRNAMWPQESPPTDVSATSSSVYVLSTAGGTLQQLGHDGQVKNVKDDVSGFGCIASDDNYVYGGRDNGRIYPYAKDLTYINSWATDGSNFPVAIAPTFAGSILVADLTKTIRRYSASNGNLLNQFTAKRTVNRLFYHGSRIYAAYTIETGIDIYNSAGSYISSWSTPNRVTALSATGNYVYVGTDIGTIEVYNTSGTLITSWYVNGWPNS